MKYRKISEIVDAEQFKRGAKYLKCVFEISGLPGYWIGTPVGGKPYLAIHRVKHGDWIVAKSTGEICRFEDEIFRKTYEICGDKEED